MYKSSLLILNQTEEEIPPSLQQVIYDEAFQSLHELSEKQRQALWLRSRIKKSLLIWLGVVYLSILLSLSVVIPLSNGIFPRLKDEHGDCRQYPSSLFLTGIIFLAPLTAVVSGLRYMSIRSSLTELETIIARSNKNYQELFDSIYSR